ncbi:MAG TPA: hypothetical protein VEY50_02365 [Lysobacter sp.]|nr:hypothetical protein [Lysobacter sp.]
MRRILALSLLMPAALACAQEPGAALRSAFGGARLEAVGHFDYRLRTSNADGTAAASAHYRLLPGSRLLHVREAAAQVWSGPQTTWRFADGQWDVLGDTGARRYRDHVAYHFLALLRDPATRYDTLGLHRVRIAPQGAAPFEAVLDPASGLIVENRFVGGVVGRELDYREFGGVRWPLRYELVRDGTLLRGGVFEDVRVGNDATLPPLPVALAPPVLAEPVDDAARVLGLGWLSTPANEYNLSLDATGSVMVFARAPTGFEQPSIFVAWREDARWSAPVPVPFSDPRYKDSDPWLTPDGRTLYFISDRPASGGAPRHDLDLWRVSLDGRRFGTPEHLSALSSEGEELGPELHDGWLYFNSTRAGGPARMSIYRARVDGTGFAAPEPLPAPINAGVVQGDFTLSPDGRTALFWSQRDGARDADLYAVRRTGDGWSAAVRVPAPVAAARFDFTPAFSADGSRLYFASMRKPDGPSDPAHPFNGQANLFVVDARSIERALDAAERR